MTNYEIIQTMTVKELHKFLELIPFIIVREEWLRADSQADGGLLTDEMKNYWKIH